MAITNGYATVAEFQQRTMRDENPTEVNLELIETSIEQASRIIDRLTGTFFYQKTLTEEAIDVYDLSENELMISSDRKTIYSPAPIISVTTITENNVALVSEEDYYLYRRQIDFTSRISTDRKVIKITGSIGYASTPDRIKNLCLAIAEVISGLGVRTFIDEDGNQREILLRSLPTWVKDGISKERRVIVA